MEARLQPGLEGQEVVARAFPLPEDIDPLGFFGQQEANIRTLESLTNAKIVARGNQVVVSGLPADVDRLMLVLGEIAKMARAGGQPGPFEVRYLMEARPEEGQDLGLDGLAADVIVMTARGKQIRPKSAGQKAYVDALRVHGVTFAIGPAGTGKTYLAMAVAVQALREHEVSRIILTRPAVEAGERLGFLPGDLQDKVDPYLRPLYDALYDILGQENYQKLVEKGVIEVAPLAYMRGRTLDDSFIILDEAQNTTPEQMKMFLTRLGFGSKAVVTGDITQIDLPEGRTSGLKQVQHILQNVKGIAFCYLTERDVVRHELVQRIIRAYADFEDGRDGRKTRRQVTAGSGRTRRSRVQRSEAF